MCGIAGYLGTKQLSDSEIQSALATMAHRGPDHASFKKWSLSTQKTLYLLHTRLGIIDIDDRSNQPFSDSGYTICFNGELYNYLELKKELRGDTTYRTKSDTEVFLKLIAAKGMNGLDKAEGMWAFAFYDHSKELLYLCRDRFGEKPLYYFESTEGFYFASEIKTLKALIGEELEINQEHLWRYLVHGYKALYKTNHSFFKDVMQFPAGTYMRLDRYGCKHEQRYWEPKYQPDDAMSYEQAVDGVKDRLLKSLELRLRSDVPLAFCMSGGVDSSSLISIAKQEFNYDVHGFTIQNTDARYEEQDMVDCLINDLSIRHTSIPLRTDGFLEKLHKLVLQHDAPVYTITYYAQWLLQESIAESGYRVSISGTGADELFTGYYDHHLAYLADIYLEDPVLHAMSYDAWNHNIAPLVRNSHLTNPDAFITNPNMRQHLFLNGGQPSPYLKTRWAEPFTEKTYTTRSLLRNRMMNEMFHESVPVIMHEEDLNAMAFSLENRSPFLDRGLFDFAYQIPTRYLIRDGRGKAVLRDAMRNITPKPILDNYRKVGFNVPIHSLLDIHNPAVSALLLNDSPVFEYVDRNKIQTLLYKKYLGNMESKFLFSFICAKIFVEAYGK